MAAHGKGKDSRGNEVLVRRLWQERLPRSGGSKSQRHTDAAQPRQGQERKARQDRVPEHRRADGGKGQGPGRAGAAPKLLRKRQPGVQSASPFTLSPSFALILNLTLYFLSLGLNRASSFHPGTRPHPHPRPLPQPEDFWASLDQNTDGFIDREEASAFFTAMAATLASSGGGGGAKPKDEV